MGIVLQVGDRPIDAKELFPLLVQYRMLPQLAREIAIDRALADLECTPEELELARQKFYQQQQITTGEQLQAWLQQQNLTPGQLEALIERDIKLEKFKADTWGNKLESYFLQMKGKLDRAVYSLIRTHEAGIAQELYFRIQEGESSFEELAREYSQGAEAQTGGLIGPVELNVPHPQIAQRLIASKPGQLQPPVRVGEWWIILRLEKYLATQLDEPMRRRLLNDLFQEWLAAQMQQVTYYSPGELGEE